MDDLARITAYGQMMELFGDYMKETGFVEKTTQAEEEIKKNPNDFLPYIKLFDTWLRLGTFAKNHSQSNDFGASCSAQAEVYLTAAVRLGHGEVRAFAFPAFEYWRVSILPNLSALQADTLEAKRQGKTLEEWKEEIIQVPCAKCLMTDQWVEKKMVLRLDDSTGRVTCSWCGLEYNDESEATLVDYKSKDRHVNWFWAGKIYQDWSADGWN